MADDIKIGINIRNTGDGAQKAKKEVEDVGNAAEKAGDQAKQASFSFRDFAQSAGLGATAILGAGAAAVGFGAKIAGDLESARQGFVALLGSSEKADATMARIKKEAASTPFEIPGLVAGTQALTAITKDGDKAIDTLLNVGAAVATSGKGQAELDRVILNLQQIASTGKLTAMDIRQFQSAIPIFNDIIGATGLTVEQLQNADNSAELLFLAFEKAAAEGGIAAEGFTAQAGTFNQVVSNMGDSITIAAADFVEQTGIFDMLKVSIVAITEAITAFTPVLIDMFQWMSGNHDIMVAVAGAVGGLLVAALTAAIITFGPMILAALAFAAAGALITTVIRILIPVIASLIEWIKQNYIIFVTLITFITVLAIPTIYRYIAGLVVMAITKMTVLIPAIIAAIVAFGAMLLAMAPLIITAGLIAGAVALLALAWKNNWLGMRDILKPIVESILSFLKPVIDFINKIIEGIKKLAGIGGSGISVGNISGVGNVSSSVGSAISIPNIPNLGVVPSIPGAPAFASVPGAGAVSNVSSITQNNIINTPVDMDSMYRDIQFAAQTQ